MTRVAQAGVGGWGKNVVRVVGELAELAWICDTDGERLTEFGSRYPQARTTTAFADLLADEEVDAVVVATPVPTHYALAKQALEAGKHVFVEKPPAMRGTEMEELVALAEQHDLVLMPGHLLLYHPGLRTVKDLVDAGELGEVACVYGNRQNLGVIRSNENALLSLGVGVADPCELCELANHPDDVLPPPADARMGDACHSVRTVGLVIPRRPVALRRSTTTAASSTRRW